MEDPDDEIIVLEEEMDENYEPTDNGKFISNFFINYISAYRNQRICRISRHGLNKR